MTEPITTQDWIDPSLGNPHQRLAVFSKLWGELMVWKDGITAKLDEMQAELAPSDSDGDIVHDMMSIEQLQKAISQNLADLALAKATVMSDIDDGKSAIETIEANASLAVDGKNTSERKAKLAAALKENAEYQNLKEALAINERGKLVKQAHFDSAEREYKRLGGRIRNLRARLEYLTMRVRESIGE